MSSVARSVTVLKLAYAKEQPRCETVLSGAAELLQRIAPIFSRPSARRIDSRTVNPWAPTVNQAVVSCAQARGFFFWDAKVTDKCRLLAPRTGFGLAASFAGCEEPQQFFE